MNGISSEVVELLKRGYDAEKRGAIQEARQNLQLAVATARKRKDSEGEARSLLELSAVVIQFDQDLVTGRNLLEDCLKVYTRIGSNLGRAYALSNLGSLSHKEGQLQVALDLLNTAQTLFEKEQDKYGMAMTLHQIGLIEAQKGDFVSAERRWRQSLLIFEGLGRNNATGQVLLSLGTLRIERYNDADQARLLFSKALTLFEAAGLVPEVQKARRNLDTLEREMRSRDSA